MTHRARAAAIIASVVLLDRVTKLYIRTAFSSIDAVAVVPGFFNIVHTENPGAAFGMLADSPSTFRAGILVFISLAVMSIIGVMLWKQQTPPLSSHALSLVFGGALGNLIDRILRGTVTDFLQVFFGSYEFPSFNVADSAISIGAFLLILELLLSRPPAHTLSVQ